MSHKIAKLTYWLLPVVCLALFPTALLSQAAQEKQDKKTEKSAHTQTVTGCLQKGDEAGEFSLAAEDGKTYGLRSATVKLDPHLGHKVTVTGSASHESKAEEKKEKEGQVEKAASKEEYANLDVTSLKMVSDTCK